VLAVIGDVSGKGMPAAMTVSLLVGTVRTLAHYTQSPGEILAAMNQRMLAAATRRIYHLPGAARRCGWQADRRQRGAHCAVPCGKELPLENGLPLGLAAESNYTETTFQLSGAAAHPADRRGGGSAREGPARCLALNARPLSAPIPPNPSPTPPRQFGQDDDITVLTLQRIVPT
jgi:hypothetical protein